MSKVLYDHTLSFSDSDMGILYVVNFKAASDGYTQFIFRDAVHEWLKTRKGSALNDKSDGSVTIGVFEKVHKPGTLRRWGVFELSIKKLQGPIFDNIYIPIGHVKTDDQ